MTAKRTRDSAISGSRNSAVGPSGSSKHVDPWHSRKASIGTHPSMSVRNQPDIELPTDERPYDCVCSWVVIRVKTVDLPSLSRLKYPTLICRHHGGLCE